MREQKSLLGEREEVVALISQNIAPGLVGCFIKPEFELFEINFCNSCRMDLV